MISPNIFFTMYVFINKPLKVTASLSESLRIRSATFASISKTKKRYSIPSLLPMVLTNLITSVQIFIANWI